MMTLLASLAGFLTSAVPHLIKLLSDYADRKHALDMLEKQLQSDQWEHLKAFEKASQEKIYEESKQLYQTYYSGIIWVDMLNATVRPVIAYGFFILYVSIKLYQLLALLPMSSIGPVIDMIWTMEDQAIFASIISFYYGQRAMMKLSLR